ncbi:hypothetical protein M0R45_017108 [Rubus argutus]|uniref:Uncharacterized protein n=1 Tax=Rubus argutus TaxID=59490 RepID=A0AAW1XVG6_RUBAR
MKPTVQSSHLHPALHRRLPKPVHQQRRARVVNPTARTRASAPPRFSAQCSAASCPVDDATLTGVLQPGLHPPLTRKAQPRRPLLCQKPSPTGVKGARLSEVHASSNNCPPEAALERSKYTLLA